MKILKQLAIILAISLAGEVLSSVLPLPIPASIYGIVILFTLLVSRVLHVDDIRETSSFLIAFMSMLFIPAGVGLMTSFPLLAENLLAYVVITAVSTVGVMVVTGRAAQAVIRREGKEGKTHE